MAEEVAKVGLWVVLYSHVSFEHPPLGREEQVEGFRSPSKIPLFGHVWEVFLIFSLLTLWLFLILILTDRG